MQICSGIEHHNLAVALSLELCCATAGAGSEKAASGVLWQDTFDGTTLDTTNWTPDLGAQPYDDTWCHKPYAHPLTLEPHQGLLLWQQSLCVALVHSPAGIAAAKQQRQHMSTPDLTNIVPHSKS